MPKGLKNFPVIDSKFTLYRCRPKFIGLLGNKGKLKAFRRGDRPLAFRFTSSTERWHFQIFFFFLENDSAMNTHGEKYAELPPNYQQIFQVHYNICYIYTYT